MTELVVMAAYLALLLALGIASQRFFRGTAKDYFLASHSIGPVLLLMSIFGTTMTAFTLVGSTGEAYRSGIGVFGMLASWSALIHTAVIFFVGIRLWAIGKRFGYVTQIQYFRDRFESDRLGLLLFPILVALVIPYLLVGLLGARGVVRSLTAGAFPSLFASTDGAVPPWLSGLVICLVVLTYIFFGGLRGAAWANTFQTCVFMLTGIVAFMVISSKLGGLSAATEQVLQMRPERLVRDGALSGSVFFSYWLIPLSIGMFPHVFQHWLTARSAKTFRLTLIAHPVFILVVWLPCVLIGVWATVALMPDGSLVVPPGSPPNAELAMMVEKLTTPLLGGLLGAGILAAIMSSLDSQFLCLGTMFTNDMVIHYLGEDRFDDRQRILIARVFVVGVVAVTYLLSLAEPRQVFPLGVWCFSGFSGLFPLVFASIYWRGTTRTGAIGSVLVTAAVWIWLFRESGYGADANYTLLGMMPVAPIVLCSTAALVVLSLLTPAPSEQTLRKFFRAADKTALSGAGVAVPGD